MIVWLKLKSVKDRTDLLVKARKHGEWLRQKHKREEAASKKEEEKYLEISEAEKKKKKARQLLKKARVKQATNINKGKPVSRRKEIVKLPDTSTLKVDQWIGVAYENGWYPGI